ncbi:hypothetical protein HNQ56_004402 [Anaerotaenia torta]|uniref:hypothetical protein n=1 Tax=Anaerotaenia torta TaxID=433293 RepID=UPI003D23989C
MRAIKNIDKLISQARKQLDPGGVRGLMVSNPYIGKGYEELLDYLSAANYRAPGKPSHEWDQFMYALISAPRYGSGDLLE